MPDHLTVFLGYQGHPSKPAVSQGIDQPGRGVLTEGKAVHQPKGFVVGRSFRSDEGGHEGNSAVKVGA